MFGMMINGPITSTGYGDRTLSIAVTGLCHQDISRHSNYVVTVPYSSLSATLRSIGRSGAKIASVTLNGMTSAATHPNEFSPVEPVIKAMVEQLAEPILEPAAEVRPVTKSSPTKAKGNPAAVAHGHGFQVDVDSKKSKKRKR